MKGHFPDQNILQGMIVPFRRLWQQKEPCYYQKVAKIIKRYVPELRQWIDSFVPSESRSITCNLPWFKRLNLSLWDVINIWLNTKYMHVGSSSHSGKFDRKDFERFCNEIGQVQFEHCFLSAVHDVGICFFNMQQCAESFLHRFAELGLKPTFAFDDDTSNDRVERVTPGYTPEPDSPPQRVWRLRRRRQYDGFNSFLDIVELEDASVSDLVTQCDTFDDFIARTNVCLEYTDDISSINNGDSTYYDGCIDNHFTAIRNQRSRRGFVAKLRNGNLKWSEDYVPILRDQYTEFREALTKKVFK